MCRESNNKLPVRLLTQTAGSAVNLTLVNLSRANNNLPTALSVKESARFSGRDDSNGRNPVLSHHFIGNFHRFSASVNGESVSVSVLNHLKIVGIQYMMGESEPPFVIVCLDNLLHFRCINVTKYVRKVTRNVVPPECSRGELADL